MLRRSFLGLLALLPWASKAKAIESVGGPVGGSYTLTYAGDPSYRVTYTWDERQKEFVRTPPV